MLSNSSDLFCLFILYVKILLLIFKSVDVIRLQNFLRSLLISHRVERLDSEVVHAPGLSEVPVYLERGTLLLEDALFVWACLRGGLEWRVTFVCLPSVAHLIIVIRLIELLEHGISKAKIVVLTWV